MLQKQIEKKKTLGKEPPMLHTCHDLGSRIQSSASAGTCNGQRSSLHPYTIWNIRSKEPECHVSPCFVLFSKLHYDGIIKGGKMFEKRQYSGTIMTMKHSGEQVVKGNRREGQIFGKQVVVQAWPSKVLEGYGSRGRNLEEKGGSTHVLSQILHNYDNQFLLAGGQQRGNCWKMTSCGTIVAQYHIAEARPAQSVCASSALGQF